MFANDKKINILTSMLMAIVILLMIANGGLFIRMNQLQQRVLTALSPSQGKSVGLKIDTMAPDFTLVDTNGEDVSLKNFSGHWVLLGFTSISCPVCKATYPYIKVFSEEASDIQVILVSRGTTEQNQQLMQEQAFDFPVLTNPEDLSQVIIDFNVPGTPFFYVIDASGIIRAVGFANTLEQLHSMVDKLIKK